MREKTLKIVPRNAFFFALKKTKVANTMIMFSGSLICFFNLFSKKDTPCVM